MPNTPRLTRVSAPKPGPYRRRRRWADWVGLSGMQERCTIGEVVWLMVGSALWGGMMMFALLGAIGIVG